MTLYLWKPIIEITILWFMIYNILRFFEGTRALYVFRGIITILAAFFLFQKLDLQVLNWLLNKLFGISVIAILVIFHTEIRQGLAKLGRGRLFMVQLKEEELDQILRELADATENLCKEKIGGLIVIENKDTLKAYLENGVLIDAKISSDLIQAIFTPNNPLHDGGLIIQAGRIMVAGCLFPLIQTQELSRVYGTRHRAALGLSEETDAIIIVVSEERRDISVVYKSKLYKDLGKEEMASKIKEMIKLSK
ncbi:MAG: diadenylate cyclase CdaA [Candidatus Omnitrophota bacterium]|nr:diadenylate cyclase CdaA [Candidatus Omnitrophota bacterium]MBU1928403.1 diadenylate cyclase CdaA [Candidatus Omnitrophota bacterium]MBU2034728.1 diadenylate cyclase CdaA [Candidatus Omnitrophota bacterium]MBU2222307.1 diadenylate cyclase CdaA [Candidatus Omnitrophota bacterium]